MRATFAPSSVAGCSNSRRLPFSGPPLTIAKFLPFSSWCGFAQLVAALERSGHVEQRQEVAARERIERPQLAVVQGGNRDHLRSVAFDGEVALTPGKPDRLS